MYDCINDYISNDRKSCLNGCPINQQPAIYRGLKICVDCPVGKIPYIFIKTTYCYEKC